MLTISTFWFAIIILASLFLGFWLATQYTSRLMEAEYSRGASDVVQAIAMQSSMMQQQQQQTDNNDDDDENNTMSFGFDMSKKGKN